MKIFVTGASGYIGGPVAEHLRDRGHQVLGLVRSTDNAAALRRRGIEPVLGDLTDAAAIASSVAATHVTINTAEADDIDLVRPLVVAWRARGTARRADPGRAPARERRNAGFRDDIRRIFAANFEVYGVRKVWRQMRREGSDTARCTVARLMREMGLKGAVRGRTVCITVSNPAAPCPLDRLFRILHGTS